MIEEEADKGSVDVETREGAEGRSGETSGEVSSRTSNQGPVISTS